MSNENVEREESGVSSKEVLFLIRELEIKNEQENIPTAEEIYAMFESMAA